MRLLVLFALFLLSIMNMLGKLGYSSALIPCLTCRAATGGASAYFFAAAVLNVVGMWCWFRMPSVGLE